MTHPREDRSLKRRLVAGETLAGTWCVIPSPTTIEIMAAAGLDFVIVDLEHGPMSFETAQNMVRAAELHGTAALLRVPTNDPPLILRALEIGSAGVVVPQVETAEQAGQALDASRYAPAGHRGFSPFTRSGGWTSEHAATLAERKNKETVTVLLVEGVDGIRSLPDILERAPADVIYLGTYDLSQAAGFPGQADHPEVLRYVEGCVRTIRAAGLAAGCLAQTPAAVERWRELGIQFIAYQADCALLSGAAAHAAQLVRGR